MSGETLGNLALFAPEAAIIIFLVILFLADGFVPQTRKSNFPMLMTVIGCGFAIWLTCITSVTPTSYFSGLVISDGFTSFFRYFFFFTAAICSYIAFGSQEIERKSRTEFSLLLLAVVVGMSLMASANHLLMLYLGIEMVSIVSFVMAGFKRNNLRSNEASFKYLVFGGVASGLMLYGFSLLYGYTGALQYDEINRFLVGSKGDVGLVFWLSLILIYGGLAYKIAAFPSHFWTPDVYEGAPTPVATFFSVGP